MRHHHAMGLRLCRAVVAGSLLLASSAHAVVPPSGPRVSAEELTAMPGAAAPKPLRSQRQLRWSQSTPPFAWSRFLQVRGTGWQAAWDQATGVPNRIYGAGIAAPGAT